MKAIVDFVKRCWKLFLIVLFVMMKAIGNFASRCWKLFLVLIVILLVIVVGSLVFLFKGNSRAGKGDVCLDCEKGHFEFVPDEVVDGVPVKKTFFSKKELQCTHCGSKDTSLDLL